MRCRIVIAVADAPPVIIPQTVDLEKVLRPEIMDVIANAIREVHGEVESAVMIKLTKVKHGS